MDIINNVWWIEVLSGLLATSLVVNVLLCIVISKGDMILDCEEELPKAKPMLDLDEYKAKYG